MKKVYESPVIKKFGKVIHNTLGSNTVGKDAGGTQTKNKP